MKTCTKCLIEKDLDRFSKRKVSKDGYRNQCKGCCNTIRRTPEAREKINTYRRKCYAASEDYRLVDRIASAKYRINNSESVKLKQALWYQDNKEDLQESRNETSRQHYLDNTERYKKNHKAWRAANPDKCALYNAKRRASKLQATPSWFDEFDELVMVEAYALARERSLLYDIKFEVDHVIPLQGKLVSGFHCGLNIQVITQSENRRKSNTFNM